MRCTKLPLLFGILLLVIGCNPHLEKDHAPTEQDQITITNFR